MEGAGFLRAGAPVSTEEVVRHMSLFYDTVRGRGKKKIIRNGGGFLRSG